MKITLIHGQNHKGSTYHIARMAAEKIGGQVEEFFLPRDLGEGCSGCLACLNKGRAFCPRAEKVGAIMDSMRASDVIIIGSPTYVMEMTSHLKAFFEHLYTAWMAHRPEEAMFSKTALVISTAAGMGMRGVTKSMAKQLFYLGVPKVFRLPFRVMASVWDEVSLKTRAKVTAKITAAARKVNAAAGTVRPGLKTKGLFLLMRRMHQRNTYVPADRAYWEEKQWLGAKRPWKDGKEKGE